MALVASAFKGLLIGQFAAQGMLGKSTPSLATAISDAVTINILSTAIVQTVDSGTLGGGVGTSKVLGINSAALKGLMVGQFASQGMLGQYSPKLAGAISEAFALWFLAGNQTQTTHSGVGLGVGQGKVTGLTPSAMEAILIGMLGANGMLGQYSPKLAKAIANSIVPHVLSSGTVITPILGAPNIVGGAGVGVGKIL